MTQSTYCYWNNRLQEKAEDLSYGKEKLASVAGWGGIQLFSPDISMVNLCYEYAKAIQQYSCGQCFPCRVGTKVILDLFEKMKKGEGEEADLEFIKNLSETISRTSMCQIGQSSLRSLSISSKLP